MQRLAESLAGVALGVAIINVALVLDVFMTISDFADRYEW